MLLRTFFTAFVLALGYISACYAQVFYGNIMPREDDNGLPTISIGLHKTSMQTAKLYACGRFNERATAQCEDQKTALQCSNGGYFAISSSLVVVGTQPQNPRVYDLAIYKSATGLSCGQKDATTAIKSALASCHKTAATKGIANVSGPERVDLGFVGPPPNGIQYQQWGCRVVVVAKNDATYNGEEISDPQFAPGGPGIFCWSRTRQYDAFFAQMYATNGCRQSATPLTQ